MTDAAIPRRIAVFASFSGSGGVERMLTNLASGFAAAGYPVDLVLAKARSEHLQHVGQDVRIVKLPREQTLANVLALKNYLDRERPAALLAAKHRAIRTAILARALSRHRLPLVGRLGTNVSGALRGKSAWRAALWRTGMRLYYRRADALVCVSEGVARDVIDATGLPESRVRVVRNPVVNERLEHLARAPLDHPWFAQGAPPVVLGVGRLTEQKDFPTLVRAFARVRRDRPARLVILGEGRQRATLEKLSAELGVEADVDMPGFVGNPYPYMRLARVFVLSSRWEGSPNVLTEALALGLPSVATDCPSGPREVLDNGTVCPLVDMGHIDDMARAITRMLDHPPEPAALRDAVADYRTETSVLGYLEALGLADPAGTERPPAASTSSNSRM